MVVGKATRVAPNDELKIRIKEFRPKFLGQVTKPIGPRSLTLTVARKINLNTVNYQRFISVLFINMRSLVLVWASSRGSA